MDIKKRLQKAAVEAKSTRTQILMGEFKAVVEKVAAKTYKTGAFGFEFVFAITDKDAKGRKIYENIVMSDKNGEALKFSDERLVRRLYNLGVDDTALQTFDIPNNSDEKGSLPTLHGAQVILTLERGLNWKTQEPEQKLKRVVLAGRKAAA
jgi:hypothetical protein